MNKYKKLVKCGKRSKQFIVKKEPFEIIVPAKDKDRAAIEAEQYYWSAVLPGRESRDTLYTEIGSVEELRERAGDTAY